MKHLVKKLSTLFIVAVLAVTMLLPTTANAATKSASEIPYAENIILSCGTGYSTTSIRYPEKIKKITSSNNDILDLKYFDARFLEPILNFLTGFTYLFIVKLVIYCLPDFPFAVKTTVPFAAIYENVK